MKRALVALLALALVGCAGPAATPTPTPAGGMLPTKGAGSTNATTFAGRCGVDAAGTLTEWRTSDGGTLAGAVLGTGEHVAVFLHQSNGTMCGWAPFAAYAAEHGVRAVLVDFCGYGASTCPGFDGLAQVKAVVDWVRANGGTTVTLVGASLGGSVALGTGMAVGADAIIDLSGPVNRGGVPPATEAAPGVTVPLLIAAAASDNDTSAKSLEQAVSSSPSAHKVFVSVPAGHGWDLVTDPPGLSQQVSALGERIIRWILGDYS